MLFCALTADRSDRAMETHVPGAEIADRYPKDRLVLIECTLAALALHALPITNRTETGEVLSVTLSEAVGRLGLSRVRDRVTLSDTRRTRLTIVNTSIPALWPTSPA